MRLLTILGVVTGFALAQDPLAQDPLAKVTPSDLARGQRLYRMNCAGCHGMDGSGGSGPPLTRAKFKRAPDNAALIGLITAGIAMAGMPPSWHLLPDGPTQLAAYVRSLGKVTEPTVPGDARHGQAIYRSSGCGSCHIVQGEGTAMGPELTDIGSRRTAAALSRAVTNPGESTSTGSVLVRVQPRGGKEVVGLRLNEDSFTIQLRGADGAFYSFRKAEVVKVEKQFDKSLMPAYATMPAPDLQDLIAYLASLRGEDP